LSAKAIAEAQEADELREWKERNDSPAQSLGTLADKLRSALKPKE
jgi:hypothetical protein